jgi:putative ABC transport system substrate-binding protein
MAGATRGLTRRRFVQGAGAVGLGLLAGCGRWPGQVNAPAQQRNPRRIGLLFAAGENRFIQQALQELGYVDGQNVLIESRIAGGRLDVLPALAAELVALPVDVIVTVGTPATVAAQQASSTIPIVQSTGAADLVREGIVASLARPGGNVTGLTAIAPELTAKRLEFLTQVVPGLARVALLWQSGSPNAAEQIGEIQAGARALGVQLQSLEIGQGPEQLDGLLAAATRSGAEALILLADPVTITHHAQIAALAIASRLPAIFDRREFAEAGGLLAYGPNFADVQRRGATYVDKILKGTKPGELPIQRPTIFDLVINLKTANALGLTIPQHVLLQATEIIQ